MTDRQAQEWLKDMKRAFKGIFPQPDRLRNLRATHKRLQRAADESE